MVAGRKEGGGEDRGGRSTEGINLALAEIETERGTFAGLKYGPPSLPPQILRG